MPGNQIILYAGTSAARKGLMNSIKNICLTLFYMNGIAYSPLRVTEDVLKLSRVKSAANLFQRVTAEDV